MKKILIFTMLFSIVSLAQIAGATIYIQDTFKAANGTLLVNHTSDSGTSWAILYGSSTTTIDASNDGVYSTTDSNMYNKGSIPTADYMVQATILAGKYSPADNLCITGRVNPGAGHRYAAIYNGAGWGLYAIENEETQIGIPVGGSTAASVPATLTPGQTYVIQLRMQGTAISMYVNGVLVLSATSSISDISAAGYAGLETSGDGPTPGGSFEVLDWSVQSLPLPSSGGAAYALPAASSVAWQGNAGVGGDIPTRTTVYTTLNPSGGDDTSAINAAIAACPSGQVVYLNVGTFNVSSAIQLKSGITLRGAGMGSTIIQGTSGLSSGYVVGVGTSSSLGSSINLSSTASKGSTTITTSAPHGWSVGTIILIDELNDTSGKYGPVVNNVGSDGTCTWCGRTSGTRSMGQMAKVTAVPNSQSATLEMPLYWTYNTGLTAQATAVSSPVTSAGLENLTVDNESSNQTNTVEMVGASNCWLLGVEVIGSNQYAVLLRYAYRNTIRGCKVHEGVPALPATGTQYDTSKAYGITFLTGSANLVENNQIYHLDMGVASNGGPMTGNVIAYNYVAGMYYAPSASWQADAFRQHSAHSAMNLFEGNWLVGDCKSDNTWGTSSDNTFFRNRNTLDTTRASSAWDYSLYPNTPYYNIVGNVIGTSGFETAYSVAIGSSSTAIYAIDPSVTTTFQHGNWDYVTNGVVWNGTNERTLPASFYLSSKPSWWGSLQWPAIGPDVSPMYPAAPAVGGGTPWGTTKPPLSAPTLLTVQ